jgi:hypothetical protein
LDQKKKGVEAGHRDLTKGENVLKIFGMPIDMTFGEFMDKHKNIA